MVSAAPDPTQKLWKTETLSYSRFQKSNDQDNWHGTIKIRNTVVLSSNGSKGRWWHDFNPLTFYKQKLRSKEDGKLTAAENVNIKVLWWWQSFRSDWCKTMTHYMCLWCANAVTFTETVTKAAKVFCATGSVTSLREVSKLCRLSVIMNGKELKKTLSWTTVFQEMRLWSGSTEGSSPLMYL